MSSFLILGVATGLLSGLLGVGGAIFIIPACTLIFGFTQHQAQGTSLAAMLLPVGIFATYQYYRDGNVNVQAAAWIALGIAVGSLVSASFVTKISQATLQKLFGLLLAFAAGKYLASSTNTTLWGGLGVLFGAFGASLPKGGKSTQRSESDPK